LLASHDLSHIELYDLEADPLEQNDLAQARAEVVAALKQRLAEWQDSLPAEPTGPVFSALR
jgi:N-acetylgalactosamine-6-sulfatase